MAYIKKLKDIDNNTVYPQTHTNAVYNTKGEQLQSWLDRYLTAETITDAENIDLSFENQGNKVTTIDENSTDIQYPSAKATYNLIVNKLGALDAGVKIEVVDILPDISEANSQYIYLVPAIETEDENIYDEYLLVENKWEHLGTTKIDLSNYYTKTEAGEHFAKLSKYEDARINIGRKVGTSLGENSVAEGYNVTANGRYSHAEGNTTIANDQAAHAEGQQTIAWGPASHTEGDNTRANGQAGHAEGYHTISEFMSQHVQGEYNIADPGSGTAVRGTYAHIVGNGAGDIYRSNAHTLDWNGNAWYQGDVYVGSTSGTNKDDGSKKLATEEYVGVNAMPASSVINAFWKGTQTSYDALETYDDTTMYIIDNSNVITFTINDAEMQAEIGMTWAEWVRSPYNPYPSDDITIEYIESELLGTSRKNYYIAYTAEERYPYAGYFVEAPDGRALHVIYNGESYVYSTETIIAGTNYTHSTTCCVVAGTRILTSLEGNSKVIEDIQPGDMVVSYNLETKQQYLTQVDELIVNKNSIEMADLTLENGYSLSMTDYHPVYTKTGFHSLTDKKYELLTINDEVLTDKGWSKIISIERYNIPERITTYTLAVRDIDELVDNDVVDNYYANGIVIHNAPCSSTWTYPTVVI